jgi:uncharacterized protein YjeT (DUF2065 family)
VTLLQVVAGVAVVMALEGLLYAAFPEVMRRALAGIVGLAGDRLRLAGLAMAVAGTALATFLVRG